MRLGLHGVKGWSKTQAFVALNSGEIYFYAILKAAAETFCMISFMKDLGWQFGGEMWGDAGAVLGIINRRGFGKTRHVDSNLVWVQQTIAKRELSSNKVSRTNNLQICTLNLWTKQL